MHSFVTPPIMPSIESLLVARRLLVHVRPAQRSDLAAVLEIYNAGIRARTASFEVTERTLHGIEIWIDPTFPLLVAETCDEHSPAVLGWIRAAPYSSRACYRGIGDYSVYVAAEARGWGIGDALMTEFVPACTRAGLWKLVGRVFPENAASRALCARHGFRELGILEKHAKLEGRWRDVIVVERLIDDNLA